MASIIQIDSNKCIGCGNCVDECLQKVLTLQNGKAVPTVDRCLECGHCVAICPVDAVGMEGYSDELLEFDESFRLDPDQFLSSVKFRRSIRRFKDTPMPEDTVQKIIEAGRFTPTGSNKQQVRYIVVDNPTAILEPTALRVFSRLKKIGDVISPLGVLPLDTRRYKIKEGFFFYHAPTVILVISNDTVDGALASTNMETMAEALGLGVLYVGFYVIAAKLSGKIRRQLGLRKGEHVVTAMALGSPDVQFRRTAPRKPANIQRMGSEA